MIRPIFIVVALILAGCAGAPTAGAPAAGAPTAPAPTAPAPTAGAPTAPVESHRVKVDASIVAVQQAGYKLVNKDGKPLYCRTDMVTGSHIVTRTTCLIEQELYDQINANQHSMQSFSSKTPGPASR